MAAILLLFIVDVVDLLAADFSPREQVVDESIRKSAISENGFMTIRNKPHVHPSKS
jgi:hypothetical protein